MLVLQMASMGLSTCVLQTGVVLVHCLMTGCVETATVEETMGF